MVVQSIVHTLDENTRCGDQLALCIEIMTDVAWLSCYGGLRKYEKEQMNKCTASNVEEA